MKKLTFLCISVFLVFSAFRSYETISIKIQNPIEKMVYKPKDTIRISAQIQAESELHNIYLKVISLKDSNVVYSKNIHTHSNSASIQEYFINPLLEKTALRLIVQTTGHDGKETASQWVNFSTSTKKK